ncbi:MULTISPECIES: hypothetical protein [unclassified Bradyrhizobium]|uniref:hypothetical protein n=1 Tax=unclassified Bradyrhizobium TaxID=2631580 RepID=UPI002915E6AD|nr:MULTISPECIES: hypothetical protein [unclassified Bradyrhizobium]
MAVLIEAISVVVKLASLFERAPTGWDGFKASLPNATLCSDNELARVGFMAAEDVRTFVEFLTASHGLIHTSNGEAVDIVVVDQLAGPRSSCSWIEYGHVNLGGNPKMRVAACRLKGSAVRQVFTPDGWEFENSLSHTYGFVPGGSEAKSLKFLRTQDGVDVYRNELTGKEVYVGRTGLDSGSKP